MEMQPDKAWAPNANSTIRLTHGKVVATNRGMLFSMITTPPLPV